MGSQQILFIVLGIIIIGLIIIAGLLIVKQSYVENNREQLISALYRVCMSAQAYYKKPTEAGGGGNSFNGFQVPNNAIDESIGTIRASFQADKINFIGEGIEDGENPGQRVSIIASVTEDNITIRINN